jgi:hypothetical protein
MKYTFDIEANMIHNAEIYPAEEPAYRKISEDEANLLKASGVYVCSCVERDERNKKWRNKK